MIVSLRQPQNFSVYRVHGDNPPPARDNARPAAPAATHNHHPVRT